MTSIFDIIIVGAGPAGAAAALALKDSGLKVAMIDKAIFPRDKVCGGDINGYVPRLLKRLLPEYPTAWKDFKLQRPTNGFRVVSPKFEAFETRFHLSGICAKRQDFDDYLLQLVQQYSETQFIANCSLAEIEYTPSYLRLFTTQGELHAKTIIGADGAHSIVRNQLIKITPDPKHCVASIRGYFKDIQDCSEDTLEIFFHKDYLPSHFWISAHDENEYTVGFGMFHDTINKRRLVLEKVFWEIIETHPELSRRFQDAKLIGELAEGDLPMSSQNIPIFGHRFLLVGDAASMINPLSGDGIGIGMISSEIAAKHLVEAFRKNDFSADFMSGYQKKIQKKYGKEMKLSYRIQQLLYDRTYLFNFFIWLMNKSSLMRKIAEKVL